MTDALPRHFGRYALFDVVGRGGMAEIFLARAATDLGVARLCVVKQILPQLADDPEFAAMLTHEAKLAARLSHANVVQVFDLGRENGRLYITMEYVDGFDLNALLKRCTKLGVALPFEFALRIVLDVLRGLDHAHRRADDEGRPLGIVHRDVSPSNVLVSCDGEVKLCDFGIAHARDAVTRESHALDAAIKGKAGYMSPEHARGEPLDARSDVFAAGIVLWEIVAGRRMYRSDDDDAPPLLERARRAEVPELPARGVRDEEVLRGIVRRALAKDRDQRTPSAAAMMKELEAYMMDAKLVASPLRLGEWLSSSFGEELAERRRTREIALRALEPLVASEPRLTPAAPSVAPVTPAPPSVTPGMPAPPSVAPVTPAPRVAFDPPPSVQPSSASPVTTESMPPAPRRDRGLGIMLVAAAVAATVLALLLRR